MGDERPPPSFDAAAYVDVAAQACGFTLTAESKAGTIANLERTYAFVRVIGGGSDLARTEPALVFAPRRS